MSQPAVSRTLLVANRAGLHARAAVAIVRTVQQFQARVVLTNERRQQADATTVLEIMSLGAGQGEKLQLDASGPQAVEAADALEDLFVRKFDEE
jgi:phosphocarrier protein NPr